MDEEWSSFFHHNVGTLVDPPEDANILGGMWVLSRPRDEYHRIKKYKARYVVFGNHQVYGLDFTDTYASVGRSDSMRILLAIGVNEHWEIMQFDIKTAFLHGDMGDTVYCRQVRGYRNNLFPNRIWQLNRSLYGSRQGARRWQQRFESEAKKFGLTPTPSDPAVYVVKNVKGILCIHLHVDDSLVYSSNNDLLQEFVRFLDSVFDVKWTAKPSLYLGIKIMYNSTTRTCTLSQAHYIETVLDRFGMTNCNPVKTPLPAKTFLSTGTTEEIDLAKERPYQQLVGCLQWIAVSTRPDISHAVSQLSRFNASWTEDHWLNAKHVLRYLKGTKDVTISYSNTSSTNNVPEVYSDADFSQCPETSRSVTGYLIRLNGGMITWNSRRQEVVAQSTAEAEYMAAADAAKHLAWVRSFLFDIFFPVDPAV